MNDRIGVIRYSPAADGSRQLILPSGEIAVVGHDLDDGGIVERFGLDAVRHADAPDWCRGVCRDGPMAGTVVYAVNRIGTTVLIALPPRPDGMAMEYKVTQVSTDAGPQIFVSANPEPSGLPGMRQMRAFVYRIIMH